MSTLSENTPSSGSTVTITLASLTNGSSVTSSTIDNSTADGISAKIHLKITTGTSPTAGGYCEVYLLASTDGGTTFDDALNGILLGFAFTSASNSTATDTTLDTAPFGPLPTHFKLLVVNRTGATLNATAGNHVVTWQPFTYTIA